VQLLQARLVNAPKRKDLGFMAASPGSGWRSSCAFANHRRYRKLISPNVIFLTLGPLGGRLRFARRKARLQ
jgi:hypothetical protein